MFFKKKKITHQQHRTYKTPFLVWGIGILGIFLLWAFAYQGISDINFRIFDFANSTTISNPNTFTWISKSEGQEIYKQEKKEEIISSETQYILLTGKWWGSHDAPDLTDTLIVLGINESAETITMLSVPRDLYVNFPRTNDAWKINEVYYHGLQRGEESAMEDLMGKVSEVIGKEVSYYVNLDFRGFIEIVDLLDGVEVTLEKNFVDNQYPDNNYWYRTFILKKWTWTLSWEVALMYVRSRYSTSDFDRSARQQYVISALKDKVSELGYFKDRKTILELYGIIETYIDTNLPITKIIDLGLEIRSWENTSTVSYNLNDSCFYEEATCGPWWFLYTPLRQYFDGKSVLIPDGATYYNLEEYDKIHTFAELIFDSPEELVNKKEIMFYNSSSTPWLAGSYSELIQPFGFLSEENTGLWNIREKKFQNSILYYNSIDENDKTLRVIQDALQIEIEKTQEPVFSSTGTVIEIIIVDEKDVANFPPEPDLPQSLGSERGL